MACSYDTQIVLEMLFDIDTDNGINDRIHGDSNRDSSCSDSCGFTFQFIRTLSKAH